MSKGIPPSFQKPLSTLGVKALRWSLVAVMDLTVSQQSMALTVVLPFFSEAYPHYPEESLSIRAFASLLPLMTFYV